MAVLLPNFYPSLHYNGDVIVELQRLRTHLQRVNDLSALQSLPFIIMWREYTSILYLHFYVKRGIAGLIFYYAPELPYGTDFQILQFIFLYNFYFLF